MENKQSYKYAYTLIWSNDDQQHVGLCIEFPYLSWLSPTQEEALSGITALVREVLDDMEAMGENPPEPLSTKKFSGKCLIRIPQELHMEIAIEAAKRKISLNSLINHKLSRK